MSKERIHSHDVDLLALYGEPATRARRAPYGRLKSEVGELMPTSYSRQLPEGAYDGQTYYDLPALKPGHWGGLISSYFFIGGMAGSAQIIAQVADLWGDEEDRSVVRNGRYFAMAGSLASPVLLIADLHAPHRWFNMLRIFRPTSPMNIGAWTLTVFGTLSGAAAAGQLFEDLTGRPGFRWFGRIFGVPAALSGCVVSTYTGTLLSATSTPLWAVGNPWLSILFGTSSMSTATAALMVAEHLQHKESSVPKLEKLELVAGTTELATTAALKRKWRREGVDGPMQEPSAKAAFRGGFEVLGVMAPLVVHGAAAFAGRRSRKASLLAAVATLAGGYLLRHVLITAGNQSAQRPQDYFRSTEPKQEPRGPVASREEAAQQLPAPKSERHLPARKPPLNEYRVEGLSALERVLKLSPQELRNELECAEFLLVQLRNRLIDALRQDGTRAASLDYRDALDHANVALSLVAGVDHPKSDVQREAIEQAIQVLSDLKLESIDA